MHKITSQAVGKMRHWRQSCRQTCHFTVQSAESFQNHLRAFIKQPTHCNVKKNHNRTASHHKVRQFIETKRAGFEPWFYFTSSPAIIPGCMWNKDKSKKRVFVKGALYTIPINVPGASWQWSHFPLSVHPSALFSISQLWIIISHHTTVSTL